MPLTIKSQPSKTRWASLIFVLLFAALEFSCHFPKEEKPDPEFVSRQAKRLGYDLENPDERITLHSRLQEISGLSLIREGLLACVQDEQGRVFFFDLNSKTIVNNVKFGKSGDYEGVELVDNRIYVVESNGKIHHFDIANSNEKEVKATTIKTPLASKNDVEGLGVLPGARKLLIACKGKAGIGESKMKGKAVYAYDLRKKKFEKEPVFSIRKNELNEFIRKNPDIFTIEKVPDFKPSGIAVHPKTNKIYVLNSVGKLLIILNMNNTIADVAVLNPKIFRQPEGICFGPNGELYIASEGGAGRGYILVFNPVP